MVPENVTVDKLLQIYGIQKQVSKPCSRRVQKAILRTDSTSLTKKSVEVPTGKC